MEYFQVLLMDAISAPSHKGKEKTSGTRAVWSDNMKKIFLDLCIKDVMARGGAGANLKLQSWTKVIEGFNDKTGIYYGQKTVKESMGPYEDAIQSVTLSRQRGVAYETTQTTTVDPERWEEYLKANTILPMKIEVHFFFPL